VFLTSPVPVALT